MPTPAEARLVDQRRQAEIHEGQDYPVPDRPPLVAVAHGSRDPRSAAGVTALVEGVRRRRPGLDVRLSFLDLSAPRLPDVLAAVHADGHRRAVVVPLLLGHAFHARVDVPGAVQRATRRHPELQVTVADVLGGDARLAAAALRRLAAVTALDDPRLGVVLAGAGSSDPQANAAVARIAATWAGGHPWRGACAAFAAAGGPTVAQALARLRRAGASRIAVAQWFLAPGLLPDRVATAARAAHPDVVLAAPLGADPGVAELVIDRYTAAAATGVETAALAAS
jgi:sirohydrochlorin ferrochelatase